jgi:hypothetical protein
MKITYLALAFLITGYLLAGDAYGEDEIYYCTESDSTGFAYDDKIEAYAPGFYRPGKFKLKINRTSNSIVLAREAPEIYVCATPFPNRPELMICADKLLPSFHFNFNNKTGRFVLSQNHGYVTGDGDALKIAYGKCDKF